MLVRKKQNKQQCCRATLSAAAEEHEVWLVSVTPLLIQAGQVAVRYNKDERKVAVSFA